MIMIMIMIMIINNHQDHYVNIHQGLSMCGPEIQWDPQVGQTGSPVPSHTPDVWKIDGNDDDGDDDGGGEVDDDYKDCLPLHISSTLPHQSVNLKIINFE